MIQESIKDIVKSYEYNKDFYHGIDSFLDDDRQKKYYYPKLRFVLLI